MVKLLIHKVDRTIVIVVKEDVSLFVKTMDNAFRGLLHIYWPTDKIQNVVLSCKRRTVMQAVRMEGLTRNQIRTSRQNTFVSGVRTVIEDLCIARRRQTTDDRRPLRT